MTKSPWTMELNQDFPSRPGWAPYSWDQQVMLPPYSPIICNIMWLQRGRWSTFSVLTKQSQLPNSREDGAKAFSWEENDMALKTLLPPAGWSDFLTVLGGDTVTNLFAVNYKETNPVSPPCTWSDCSQFIRPSWQAFIQEFRQALKYFMHCSP